MWIYAGSEHKGDALCANIMQQVVEVRINSFNPDSLVSEKKGSSTGSSR